MAQGEADAPNRWLDRDGLANYICVNVSELPRLARRARIPQPSLHLGPRSPRWDRIQVDAMFQAPPAPPELTLVRNDSNVESYFGKLKSLLKPK